MKIFLAGASGALGKRLIRQLIERGHSVVGTTRSEQKAASTWFVLMDEARGASNEKARRELAWQPSHPSWRRGFAEALVGGRGA